MKGYPPKPYFFRHIVGQFTFVPPVWQEFATNTCTGGKAGSTEAIDEATSLRLDAAQTLPMTLRHDVSPADGAPSIFVCPMAEASTPSPRLAASSVLATDAASNPAPRSVGAPPAAGDAVSEPGLLPLGAPPAAADAACVPGLLPLGGPPAAIDAASSAGLLPLAAPPAAADAACVPGPVPLGASPSATQIASEPPTTVVLPEFAHPDILNVEAPPACLVVSPPRAGDPPGPSARVHPGDSAVTADTGSNGPPSFRDAPPNVPELLLEVGAADVGREDVPGVEGSPFWRGGALGLQQPASPTPERENLVSLEPPLPAGDFALGEPHCGNGTAGGAAGQEPEFDGRVSGFRSELVASTEERAEGYKEKEDALGLVACSQGVEPLTFAPVNPDEEFRPVEERGVAGVGEGGELAGGASRVSSPGLSVGADALVEAREATPSTAMDPPLQRYAPNFEHIPSADLATDVSPPSSPVAFHSPADDPKAHRSAAVMTLSAPGVSDRRGPSPLVAPALSSVTDAGGATEEMACVSVPPSHEPSDSSQTHRAAAGDVTHDMAVTTQGYVGEPRSLGQAQLGVVHWHRAPPRNDAEGDGPVGVDSPDVSIGGTVFHDALEEDGSLTSLVGIPCPPLPLSLLLR